MIVVLGPGTSDARRDEIVRELEGYGLGIRPLTGGGRTLLHVTSGPSRRARRVQRLDGVEALVPTSGPRLRRTGHRIYPYHFLHWCAAGIAILGLMVLWAGLFPPGPTSPIEPERPPADLAWPWYLRAPRAVLTAFPPGLGWIGAGVLAAGALALLSLPWWDRTSGEGLRARWPFVAAGVALLVGAAVATFAGGMA